MGSESSASEEGGVVKTEQLMNPFRCGFGKRWRHCSFSGETLTQGVKVPLPTPLKVEKVKGRGRLGLIRINKGKVEDLVHIDSLILHL
ncbi:hypothetical protein SUGI_1022430 [Cryptomeria japonica]|nr:hypothetical protein SUGI_1022430 [Cryptomeria japonica]